MLDRDRGSYNGGEGREKMERWGKEIGRKTRGGRGKKAGEVAEAIRWQTKLAKRPGTGCFQLHYRTVINWCPRCSIVSEGRLGSGSRGVSFFAARQNHTVRALSLSLSLSPSLSPPPCGAPARHVRAGSWIFFPLCSGDAMSINSTMDGWVCRRRDVLVHGVSVFEFLTDENPIFILSNELNFLSLLRISHSIQLLSFEMKNCDSKLGYLSHFEIWL